MGDRDNAAFDDIELSAGNYIDRQEYLPGLYLDEGYTDLGTIRFNNDRGETADSRSHWAQYEKSRWPTQPRLQSGQPRPRPGQVRQRNCAQPQRPPQRPPQRRTREGFVGIRELYGDRGDIEAARAVGEGVPAGYDPNSGSNWARLLPGQSACVVPGDCVDGYPMREDWPVSSKSWAKNEPWNSGPPTGDCGHGGHGGHSKSGFSPPTVDGGQLMQMLQTLLLFILVILMAVKLGFSVARHATPAGPITSSRYDAVK